MERSRPGSERSARLTWETATAAATWAPRLQRLWDAWDEIGWRSVALDVRRCCTIAIRPDDFAAQADRWAQRGLSVLPLGVQNGEGGYAVVVPAPRPGSPLAFHLALGREADLARFKQAWHERDDDAMGQLLGYPACCRRFFRRVWVDQGLIDTTWQMVAGTEPQHGGPPAVAVSGPPHGNVLWRWLGIRAVPHLPCTFDCQATAAFGAVLVQVGREAGYAEEMDWLLEILSWPVEWSALQSVAQVKTPIITMTVPTDPSPGRRTMRWQGTGPYAFVSR